MEVKTQHGKLKITDRLGQEIKLDPEEVAELVSYLKIKLGD